MEGQPNTFQLSEVIDDSVRFGVETFIRGLASAALQTPDRLRRAAGRRGATDHGTGRRGPRLHLTSCGTFGGHSRPLHAVGKDRTTRVLYADRPERCVHSSITDWRGELQVRAVVGAAVRLVLRAPVATLIVPTAALVLSQRTDLEEALLSAVPFGLLNRWTAAMVHPSVLVALPLIALAWVRVARLAARPTRQRPPVRLRAWAQGTATAIAVGALVLWASDALGTQALLTVTLFATLVPAHACDPNAPGVGFRLMSGHRWRWIGAWLLVHACLAGIFLLLFALGLALAPGDPASLHLVRPSTLPWLAAVDVQATLTAVYEGLAVGLTIALSAATYAGLKQRRDVDDAQRWLEALS